VEAREAIALAAEFGQRLEDVQKLSGKEQEETLKHLGLVGQSVIMGVYVSDERVQGLDQAEISVLRKPVLRSELKKLKDTLIAEVKARETAAAKAVRETREIQVVVDAFDRPLKASPSTSKRTRMPKHTLLRSRLAGVSKWVHLKIAITEYLFGSLQSLQQVLGQGKTLSKAVYVLSVDDDAGKVAHGCFVPPQNVHSGFDAKTWANAVAEVMGGKVGWSCMSPFGHWGAKSFCRLVESLTRPKA